MISSWRRSSQSGRTARCKLVAVADDVDCIESPWQRRHRRYGMIVERAMTSCANSRIN